MAKDYEDYIADFINTELLIRRLEVNSGNEAEMQHILAKSMNERLGLNNYSQAYMWISRRIVMAYNLGNTMAVNLSIEPQPMTEEEELAMQRYKHGFIRNDTNPSTGDAE